MNNTKDVLADGQARYNSIDLGKFVMALCVVAMHTYPLADCSNSTVIAIYDTFKEAAVPFFFLATGYLLAARLREPYGSQENIHIIRRYLIKIIKLYLIWSVIYFPLAVYEYVYYGKSVTSSVVKYVQGLVFTGEHYNSWMLWYLLSAIYAVIFVLLCLKRNISSYLIFTGGVILLLISAGIDTLMQSNAVLPVSLQQFRRLIAVTISNGRILRGAFYIPCGMVLANKKPKSFISGIIFFTAFAGHCVISSVFVKSILAALYATALFELVLGIKLKNSDLYPILRKMSTVIYFVHMYVWSFYYFIVYVKLDKATPGTVNFFVTAAISVLIAYAYIFIRYKGRNANSYL